VVTNDYQAVIKPWVHNYPPGGFAPARSRNSVIETAASELSLAQSHRKREGAKDR
jgi:hypothetical protein